MTDSKGSLGERMATVEEWQIGHEKLCADRYNLLLKVISFGGALVLLAATWSLNNITQGQKEQTRILQTLRVQVAEQPHNPPSAPVAVTVQPN